VIEMVKKKKAARSVKRKNKNSRSSGNFLVRNYKASWKYIKDSRDFIYSTILVFAIFAAVGFFFPFFFNEQILDFIKEILEKTEGMSQGELIWFIFSNNIQSSFFGMILGFFLGIFSVLIAVANGYVLGFVSELVVTEAGYLALWRLLPHGIFELTAIFISLGLGIRFGTFIFQKKKGEAFKNYLWESLRVFIFIVVPLLVIAAIIEGSLIFLGA
jgi:stage II sporulation protein M